MSEIRPRQTPHLSQQTVLTKCYKTTKSRFLKHFQSCPEQNQMAVCGSVLGEVSSHHMGYHSPEPGEGWASQEHHRKSCAQPHPKALAAALTPWQGEREMGDWWQALPSSQNVKLVLLFGIYYKVYFTAPAALWAGHFQGIVTLLQWLITWPLASCLITLFDTFYNYYLESFIT